MMEGISDIDELVESYILSHDLARSTVAFYWKTAGVFKLWFGGPVPLFDFTVSTVNRFLRDKQDGPILLSSHYRKSLRNGLRALLNYADRPGKLRPVKWEPLQPESWTPDEVTRLVEACRFVRGQERRSYMRALILFGYYTGLSGCDLYRIARSDFDEAGVLRFRRSKTGKLVVIAIPSYVIELLSTLPPAGPILPLTTTPEAFRRLFKRIVKRAKLQGTFKKLRKSSGTLVESMYPGAGHLHLGNTRAVFELHYLNRELGLRPMGPPSLKGGGV